MKMVCIDNSVGNARHLNIGQICDADLPSTFSSIPSPEFSSDYYILKIDGHISWVRAKCLIPIEEYRNRKLGEIGI